MAEIPEDPSKIKSPALSFIVLAVIGLFAIVIFLSWQDSSQSSPCPSFTHLLYMGKTINSQTEADRAFEDIWVSPDFLDQIGGEKCIPSIDQPSSYISTEKVENYYLYDYSCGTIGINPEGDVYKLDLCK